MDLGHVPCDASPLTSPFSPDDTIAQLVKADGNRPRADVAECNCPLLTPGICAMGELKMKCDVHLSKISGRNANRSISNDCKERTGEFDCRRIAMRNETAIERGNLTRQTNVAVEVKRKGEVRITTARRSDIVST